MTVEQMLATNGLVGGAARRLLVNNMDLNCLRTNVVLPHEEWKDLDDRIIALAQERLVLVQDLIDAGLTHDVGGLGKTISEWTTSGDMSPANVSMEPESEGERDLINFETERVPVPVIHKDFRLGVRQLAAAKESKAPIDKTNSDAAARKVGVMMEDLTINGYRGKFLGSNIYGIMTHPAATSMTLDDGVGNLLAFTPETAADMILAMIQAQDDKDFNGPYNLYVPTGLSTILYKMIPNTNGKLLKTYLEEIDLISKIRVSSRMPKGHMSLVQMDNETIDLAVGQELTPVEWDEKGGMVVNFKIMTAMAPRIKARQDNTLGIVNAVFDQGQEVA